MTHEELQEYYADLLILQYVSKPKARAHIKALADIALIDELPLAVRDAFTIGDAKGEQLDILGKYAGVSRVGYTFTKQITLNDSDFTKLIKLAIIKNAAGSSLSVIQDLLNEYFLGELYVFDHMRMRIGYYLSSSVASTDLAEMFIVLGLLPKPMGVSLSSVIRYPVLDSFFGYRTYQREAYNVKPYNTYSGYVETWPWVSYQFQIGRINGIESMISTEEVGTLLAQESGGNLIA